MTLSKTVNPADVSLKINLKQSKGGDFSLRTVVNLPNGSGKKNKVAVLCEADKLEEAKRAGADIVGSDDLIEKIAAGKIDFVGTSDATITPYVPSIAVEINNIPKMMYLSP